MADENEIVAIFRADIEQFKAQMAELGVKLEQVEAKTESAGTSTKKFAGQTKGAAGSISTLGKGLSGVAGLLGLTGRLFGVNTDKVQALVFASQQFARVGQDIAKAQKLATAATAASAGATETLTIAQRALNFVTSIGTGGILAIGAALAAGVAIIFSYNKASEERKKLQEDLNKLDKEAHEIFIESQQARRDAAKQQRENTLQEKVNAGEINELQKERQLLEQQLRIDNKLNELTRKKADEDALRRGAGKEILQDEQLRNQNTFIDKQLKIEEKFAADSRALKIKEDKAAKDTVLAFQQEILDVNSEFTDLKTDVEKKAAEEDLDAQIAAGLKKIEADKKLAEERAKVKAAQNLENIRAEIRANAEILKAEEDALDAKKKADAQEADELFKGQQRDEEATREMLKEESDKRLKDAEEARQKRIEAEQQVIDTIFSAYEEAFDKRQELLDKEISAQETNIETQRRLAEQGLDNTLAFEQRRASELRREQQKEVERQKRVKLLETFLNSLAEFSKTDPKTALSKALLQVALAQAASAVFAEEGGIIGEIGERSNLSRKHKGGGDVLLHAQTGEGILSRREMDNLGKRNFHLLKDAARFPIRDDVFAMPQLAYAGGIQPSNGEVVKELRTLQAIIKNQPRESFDINKWGEYTRTMVENGVTEVTKGKLKKPRFRA